MNKRDSIYKKLAMIAVTGVLFLLLASLGSSVGLSPLTEGDKKSNECACATPSHAKANIGMPTLISPKGIVGTYSPKFIWRTVPGSTQYTLKLKYPSGTITLETLDADDVTVDSTSEWVSNFSPLAPGNYIWWVQAKVGTSVGPWSYPLSFKITGQPPGSAIPISPRGLTSSKKPIFTWGAAPGATSYTLQVDNASSENGLIHEEEDIQADDVTSGSKCSFGSPIRLSGDLFWRVQAHNDFGVGPMSAYKYFEIVG